MMGCKRFEMFKSFVLMLLVIFIMFIIFFLVYYIFIVLISLKLMFVMIELEFILKQVILDLYREVFFGFFGDRLMEDFEGRIIGKGIIQNGKFYVIDGILIGIVKYGFFMGLKFEILVFRVIFIVNGGFGSGDFSGNVKGMIILMRINDDGIIGFGIVRNVIFIEGMINGVKVSGQMDGYIRVRDIGKVEFIVLGKFVNFNFFKYLKNSFILVIFMVVLVLIFVVLVVYVFLRFQFFGREYIFYFYLMFMQVLGGFGIVGFIVFYGMFVKFGFYGKFLVLVFIYVVGSVFFNMWFFKGYIDLISFDFDEVVFVDGVNYFQIIRYVFFLMVFLGIVMVVVFVFIGGWMEFILVSFFLGQESQLLVVWIYLFLGGIGRGIDWSYFVVVVLLFVLFVFVMFIFVQNYIRSGFIVGGFKE